MIGQVEDQSSQQHRSPIEQTPASTDNKKLSLTDIDMLLLENSEILTQLAMQGQMRRNRNVLNARMCILVHRLERNLIRMAKHLPPESVGDPQYIESQKNRFINFYKQRNGSRR